MLFTLKYMIQSHILDKIYLYNKMKNYHTVGTAPKSNGNIVERDKIYTHSTQLYDCWISCMYIWM